MKILNLKIEDFGCFSNRTFELSEGVNLIEGPNESGKSTLLSFIKFMLYGMPQKKGENATERARSISWRSGVAAGSMTVSVGGKVYTINRNGMLHVTPKRETFNEDWQIIDEETGLEVYKGQVPGELFLGVPLSVFESTSFVRQLGSSDIDKDDVSRALENMLVSADENLSLRRALDKIDAARKLYLHKNGKGGSIYELEGEQTSLKSRLAKAEEDYKKILAKTDFVNETKLAVADKRAELDRLENVAGALGMISVVKRFDLMHKTEDELQDAKQAQSEYEKNCVASYGSMPDEGHLSALGEANAAEKNAEELLSAARSQAENAKNTTEQFKSVAFAPFNEKIREASDSKAITDGIRLTASKSEKKKKGGKATVIMAIISALAAVGAFFISLPVSLGIAALFILLLVIGISGIASAKRLFTSADDELSSYGISISCGDLNARIDALDATFKRYKDALAALSEHERSQALAESAAKMRKDDLDRCKIATSSLMNMWNGGENNATDAIEKGRSIIAESARLRDDVTALERALDTAKAELSEYDEKDIRARVPASLLTKFTVKDIEKAEEEKRFVALALKQYNDRCMAAERELIMLEKETENPVRLSADLDAVTEKIESESFTHDSLVLAYESLERASMNIRKTVTPLIKSRAGEFMSALTGEKYASIGIDEDYNMTAESASGTRSVNLLSAGTQDLAYLSLRMALLSIFYNDELPPLTLDDALTQLDDQRAKNALTLLDAYTERNGQALLFTCHTRERAFLKDKTGVNIITLG